MSGRRGHRILVTTDDLERAGGIREAFQAAGFTVELVTPSEELRATPEPSLLILTGNERGTSARPQVVQAHADLKIPIFMVGGDTLPLSEQTGFTECFPKESHPGEVLSVAQALLERLEVQRITGIVGASDAIKEVMERVLQIAPVGSTVLVTGESGTGKELVARGIHDLSSRKHKPFIAVNVAALSETLLESELFGHEKGAFTGAVGRRKGLLVAADGGTIFLDEIGELTLPLQAKLLRTLEQGQVRPVGSSDIIDVDVRIVAATNRDLLEMTKEGQFREDLYYRLNVVNLEVPALRERPSDIPLLVQKFMVAVAREGEPILILPEVWDVLESYSWPGNVRQLRNLVERVVALSADGKVTISDLPPEIRFSTYSMGAAHGSTGEGLPYAEAKEHALRDFHRRYLPILLNQNDGNVSRAAEAAEVSRRTMHRWLADLRTPENGGAP